MKKERQSCDEEEKKEANRPIQGLAIPKLLPNHVARKWPNVNKYIFYLSRSNKTKSNSLREF